MGFEAVGYSLSSKKDSLHLRLSRRSKIQKQFADIRDFKTLLTFIEKDKPAAIIHLAAQPLVLDPYNQSRLTLDTDLMGKLKF